MRLGRCAAVLALCLLLAPAGSTSADTIDGQFNQTGPLSAGATFNLTIAGRGGVPPSGADSVALNVTAVNPTAGGYLTIWPTGQPKPNASNLNFVPGQIVPNMVIVALGSGGQISLFSPSGTVDVLVDVLGWFPTGSLTGLPPARLMDSRTGGQTFDSAFAGGPKLSAGATFNLTIAGRGGVPPSGADSVALNVTAVNPTAGGYLTIWPTGQPKPNASNLNFVPGQIVPNMVIVALGSGGQISLFSPSGTVDVLVDVLGWFPTGSLTGLPPARLMDSRTGGQTFDSAFAGGPKLSAGATFNLTIAGRGGVPPSGADSVALNVTAVNPTAGGYLTIWPTGQPKPNASNLNFVPGQIVPNMVIVALGSGGQISLFSPSGTVDVLVDVLGWFPTGSLTGLPPARLMDSRVPPPPPPPPPPAVFTLNSGTHLVNVAIPPGRYVAVNAHSGCYWERLSGLGGTFGEILANDFQGFTGRVIVDVLPSDVAFKFDSDCVQFKTYTAPAAAPVTSITPGAHVIGAHIVSGTYTTLAASGCYWERLTGFHGGIASIIANDFVSSPGVQFVTIGASDVGFYSDSDCGTWVRI